MNNSMVVIVATYACEIWCYAIIRELESLQMTYTSTGVVYGGISFVSTVVCIKCESINHWSWSITGKILRSVMLCTHVYYTCIYLVHLFRHGWII